MKFNINRHRRITHLAYVLLMLVLIALWINPIYSWYKSAYFQAEEFRPIWRSEGEHLSEFRDAVAESYFQLYLDFQSYDIVAQEVTLVLTAWGLSELPADFTKYKARIILSDRGTRTEIFHGTSDWLEPDKKALLIFDHIPIKLRAKAWGHYPFNVSPVEMDIQLDTDYLKTDGAVGKDKPVVALTLDTVNFRYDTRVMDTTFQDATGKSETTYATTLYFEIIERKFTKIIFVFFFVLVNILIILTLGIKELSSLLESIAAIVIGLWAMQNIILPESVAAELGFLAEQTIINTYLLTGIVVIIWLLRQGIDNRSEKLPGTQDGVRIYRVRKRNIRRRVIPSISKKQSTQTRHPKRGHEERKAVVSAKQKKYKRK